MSSVEKALKLLKELPRVTIGSLKPLPGTRPKKKKNRRGQHGGSLDGRGDNPIALPRIGFEGGQTPFHLAMPKEPYYEDFGKRKQYPEFALLQLQRLIDLGRIDTKEPIDLTTLCNTKIFTFDPWKKQYGVNLVDKGADIFAAQINIEVQWTDEMTIAAIEKNGGTITTKFYDYQSLEAMKDPVKFFRNGRPIPRCKLPSMDVLEYYSDAKNRGYLADPEEISKARKELADKYGYHLPDLKNDELYEMLTRRKDPRQIWFGLEPGWVVNMKHKTVFKPKDPEFVEYYKS